MGVLAGAVQDRQERHGLAPVGVVAGAVGGGPDGPRADVQRHGGEAGVMGAGGEGGVGVHGFGPHGLWRLGRPVGRG